VMGVLTSALLDWYEQGGQVDLADALDAVLAQLESGLSV